ncbi:unnamed protein product, partial [Mycena citricolor]
QLACSSFFRRANDTSFFLCAGTGSKSYNVFILPLVHGALPSPLRTLAPSSNVAYGSSLPLWDICFSRCYDKPCQAVPAVKYGYSGLLHFI